MNRRNIFMSPVISVDRVSIKKKLFWTEQRVSVVQNIQENMVRLCVCESPSLCVYLSSSPTVCPSSACVFVFEFTCCFVGKMVYKDKPYIKLT